jgi:hypothetical protein
VPDKVGSVRQARTVMPADAMKEHRLEPRVSKQVGSFNHLIDRRFRSAHRNQEPFHTGFRDNFSLSHIFGIVGVDCRERHDRFNTFSRDNSPQSTRMLPRSADQSPWIHDA